MSKKKNTGTAVDVMAEVKPFVITEAKMNDGFCHYTYEVKEGVNKGDIQKVKGAGLFEEDMTKAFTKLNVHLAAVDDVFLNSGISETTIAKLRGHQLTFNYSVSSIKISGEDENRSVIISGTKNVTTSNGHMSVATPKILMAKLSGYDWYKDLTDCVANICEEVEAYKNGKCTAPVKEEQADHNQLTIESELEEMDELESGKV